MQIPFFILKKVFKKNPGLKYEKTLGDAFKDAWEEARYIIFSDTEIKLNFIPEESPYTFKEAINKASEITEISSKDIFFLNNLF